ncbi:DUF4845 domain-containing protein [Sphaerotilus microaerophilus]|jgi:cell division protein FtsL|uniref:DUF4845 domain-containing protein n=1 Tax=Sphaerotilus microaerophilus TaxID=2914710 RepID=A0ABM7YIZ6_9BURK|nr:DUF4845 domain-containing protein [Sphaerotilus sp. FB-5]BDI04312.1 hypothetical protein CATMQ487_12820 [Sphaerotilus sp. FB-5]
MTTAQHTSPMLQRRGQRGLTLISLVFWAILVSTVLLLTLRVVPTVNEYYTAKRAIEKVAQSGGSTVSEIRTAFDRYKDVEYSITSISGKDLVITKENDRVVVAFAYDKEIELIGPVSLLIKYRARSN